MKILKISLITFGSLLLLLLIAAILIPRLYKEELLEVVKEEANRNLRATVAFKDLDVSLFRQFPLLSLRLDELSITGQDEFQDYSLLKTREMLIAISIWDLIKKDAPLKIRKLHLKEPDIQILVLENGLANYDITIPDSLESVEEEEETAPLQGAIEAYGISNGRLMYEDRSMPMKMSMIGLNHQGDGDFSSTQFDLNTLTSIDTMDFTYDGMAYFSKVKTHMDANIAVDLDAMKFTLKDNDLKINDFSLNAEGSIRLEEEDTHIDLVLKSPSNQLKDFWSILPGAYTADYAGLESSGTFDFNMWIKGTNNATSIPAFEISSLVKDGRIKYPALPHAIDQMQLDLVIRQPSTTLDAMEIDLKTFQLRVADQPVKGFLSIKDPMNDPDVKAGLEGTIDLAMLRQAFPVEAKEINGRIDADVQIAARMSALDQGRYEDTDIRGTLALHDIVYQGLDQPVLRITSGVMTFSPAFVEAKEFKIQAGKSDLAIGARIDNILAMVHPNRTLKGHMTLRSNLLDLNEWSSEEPAPAAHASLPEEEEMSIGLPSEQFDLSLDAAIGKLLSQDHEINQLIIKGSAGPVSIKAEELSGKLGSSDFHIKGQLENVIKWMSGNAVLRGAIQFKSTFLDLNELMPQETEGASVTSSSSAVIPVPPDVQIKAQARIDHLRYTNLDLHNVVGSMTIGDQTILLEETRADGLGGKMLMSGAYITKNLDSPEFHFKYDFSQLDFPQVFEKVNTFQKLAPIGAYLQGKFSTSLVMDGRMDKTMSPIINTIEAAGFLETFNAILKGYKPIEGLAEKLNIAELKTMNLKNSKNWFEIKNGAVELKEFDYQFKDIAMKIGGSHSFEQEMNYTVKAKIPRKYLDKTGITAQANTGLKWLEGEAKKKGFNVSVGEFVNLAITMTGTIKNPSYGLKVLGMEGEDGSMMQEGVKEQLTDAVEKAKDSLTDLAKQKAEEWKQEAQDKVNVAKDSLEKLAQAKIDSALVRAKEEAEKKLGEEAAKKLDDIAGDKAKQEAEKLKEKMKKWDPLGKKKD